MHKTKHKILNIFINVLIFYFVFNISVFAQISKPDTITAYKSKVNIKIDGILNEDVWSNAQIISNFTQRELNNGQPVTERTEAAIIYDENNIYIGLWCYDSEPDKITAKYFKRDFYYWFDDNFEIVFDTYDDNSNGYIFVVNPNGARSDLLVSNDGTVSNRDWNGVWDAAALINDKGWFAEVVIPFSTLKYPNHDNQVWGINLERNIRRKQEQVFWQGWSRNYDFEHVSQAGTIVGINGINGKENIELKPYAKVGAQNQKGRSGEWVKAIGGDINYLVTPTLKLNLTLNTDFSQVESDQVQANLTKFETNYAEKRDFFLENADLFSFNFAGGAYAFYSRSIGLKKQKEIPIIGGVRLTGKQGNTNIGLISIQTDSKDTFPSENFSVIRIKQEISPNFSIGGIATSKISNESNNYLYGTDIKYNTAHFMGNNKLYLGASFSQSFDKKYDDKDNYAYSLWATFPNDELYLDFNYAEVNRNFKPGVGALFRTDYKRIYFLSKYRPRPDLCYFNQLIFSPVEFTQLFNSQTGVVESTSIGVQPLGFYTKKGDFFSFTYYYRYENEQDGFNMYFDNKIMPGKYHFNRYNFDFQSFEGRDFAVGLSGGFGSYYSGRSTSGNISLAYSLNKHLVMTGNYDRQWIEINDNFFHTDNYGLRMEYSFNPKLYSTLYTQWSNFEEAFIINFRINWIPEVGSDLYLVFNQVINTGEKKMYLENTSVVLKYIHRIGI